MTVTISGAAGLGAYTMQAAGPPRPVRAVLETTEDPVTLPWTLHVQRLLAGARKTTAYFISDTPDRQYGIRANQDCGAEHRLASAIRTSRWRKLWR